MTKPCAVKPLESFSQTEHLSKHPSFADIVAALSLPIAPKVSSIGPREDNVIVTFRFDFACRIMSDHVPVADRPESFEILFFKVKCVGYTLDFVKFELFDGD